MHSPRLRNIRPQILEISRVMTFQDPRRGIVIYIPDPSFPLSRARAHKMKGLGTRLAASLSPTTIAAYTLETYAEASGLLIAF